MTNGRNAEIHPYYKHAEQPYGLLPGALERLRELQRSFAAAGEDFLAIELRTMADRLEEIERLLAEGPQG